LADYRRIVSPPSDVTGPLGAYLREVARAINDIPQLSAFSGANPNASAIAGYPGDLLVNLTSSNTDRRVYVMSGSLRQKTTSGWTLV
jgi:hypothetical protein